jgi:hypothetical protein
MYNQESLNMDINNIVENIIKIPTEFYKLRNISIYELFKKSKYCDYYNYITENDIKNYLLNNRNYIKDWFIYSEDKRTDKGYYVVLENEKYEVGYYDGKKRNIINTYNLSQDIDACANFIKLELENQRRLE